MPDLYGDIIKESINVIKSKNKKKEKIVEILPYVESKKLAYDIFNIEEDYTYTQYNKIIQSTKNNVDIIMSMIKNEKTINVKSFYRFLMKETNDKKEINKNIIIAIFKRLYKEKKLNDDLIIKIREQQKNNNFDYTYNDFCWDVRG